jgi:hypothetical protein
VNGLLFNCPPKEGQWRSAFLASKGGSRWAAMTLGGTAIISEIKLPGFMAVAITRGTMPTPEDFQA